MSDPSSNDTKSTAANLPNLVNLGANRFIVRTQAGFNKIHLAHKRDRYIVEISGYPMFYPCIVISEYMDRGDGFRSVHFKTDDLAEHHRRVKTVLDLLELHMKG